jgi:hypothetical protein
MSRIVKPSPAGNAPHAAGGDNFIDRVAKYIPAEIVAAYLALQGIVTAAFAEADQQRFIWLLVVVGFLLIVTPLYLRRLAVADGLPWGLQAIIAEVALLIWVYALAILPQAAGFYNGALAAGVLVAFTLLAGLLQPTEKPTAN